MGLAYEGPPQATAPMPAAAPTRERRSTAHRRRGRGIPRIACAGVPIASCTPREAAETTVRIASSPHKRGIDVHLCNAYTIAVADRDDRFKSVLREASINFPDGKSVVWANRLTHRDIELPSQRVYGPDLFLDVLRIGQDVGLSHYLLGSTPAVLAELERNVRRQFPSAVISGSESPPFRPLTPEEREEQVDRVRRSGADVVWVGLGTPKQDWEAAFLAERVPAVVVAVGAAFDFVAGTKRQAPTWMQDRGLEWVFRLATEPRRLWRRYLFGNARFIKAVVVERRTRDTAGSQESGQQAQ